MRKRPSRLSPYGFLKNVENQTFLASAMRSGEHLSKQAFVRRLIFFRNEETSPGARVTCTTTTIGDHGRAAFPPRENQAVCSFQASSARLRIYAKGDRTRLFWKGWMEGIEWFELMKGGHDALHEKMLTCITLLCFLFTLMCWDATFTPIFSGYNASSSTSSTSSTTDGCGSYMEKGECNQHWADGCYWDDEECNDADDAMDSLLMTMYTSALSIILSTPCLIFIEWLISSTIAIPMPARKESDDGDNSSCLSEDVTQRERERSSTPAQDECQIKEASDDDHEESHKLALKRSMSGWISEKMVRLASADEIDIEGDENISNVQIEERANAMLLQQGQQGESSKNKISGILTWNMAKKSIKLEDQLADLCNANQTGSAECLLLDQARWDYMNTFEKRAVKRITLVLNEEEEEEEEETELSRCNVRVRHILGWFLVVSYMFITAYYVCLFGINYGSSYTNAWLKGFFIAFAQEISIFVPLRVMVFYCILPGISNPNVQPKRFCQIKDWFPSRYAAKSFPQLHASRLILASVNQDKLGSEDGELENCKADFEAASLGLYLFLERNGLEDVFQSSSKPTRGKGYKIIKAALLVTIFSVVLFFPETLADTLLDLFIAYGSGYMILGFYQAYLISGFSSLVFWSMVGIVLTIVLVAIFVFTQPRLRRRLWTRKDTQIKHRMGSLGGRGRATAFRPAKNSTK